MDEDNNIRPLDKLLAMLKDAGWDCIADEADSSLIVIDANGDPHECWDGGTPGYVNVCIALSIENAMDYFSDPNQIYLKDENAKLRDALKTLMLGTVAELCDTSDVSACKKCAMRRNYVDCAVTEAMDALGIGMHGEPMELEEK